MPHTALPRRPRPATHRLAPVLVMLAAAGVAACSTSGGETDARAAASHVGGAQQPAAATPAVVVYKSPTCGCCAKWVDHMRARGFAVEVHDTADVTPVRAAHGVTERLASCHTALVGGYVVEGHVPAEDVARLLRERPAVAGIAAPGMPAGSPGMEMPGMPADRYDVIAFERGGATRTFASH